VGAMDSTAYSLRDPSFHYMKRIGENVLAECPVKLSVLVDTARKKFLSARLRVHRAHDVRGAV
jgi:hypothetical protein